MSKVKVCFAQSCHTVLKPPKRKFCSDKCSRSYHNKKFYAEQQGAVYEPENEGKPVATPDTQKRRGEVYEKLYEFDLGPKILKKEITKQDAAEILSCSKAAVSYAYAAWLEDMETKEKAENWTLPARAEKSLADFKIFRDNKGINFRDSLYSSPNPIFII